MHSRTSRAAALILTCLLGWTLPEQADAEAVSFAGVLAAAKRIPTSAGWFEIIRLPNHVYALYEPGHAEKVNSFFIAGSDKDLLYDTGMGIASIREALDDLRKAEGLPEREPIVLNSHAHLDHIGGNAEFDRIYAFRNDWRIRKLTEGIAAGDERWIAYFGDLTPPPQPPPGFDPRTHAIRPVPLSALRYVHAGEHIDLGNRRFTVIPSRSHTEDSVILYDARNKLLFTGDVFVPDYFYVLDFAELEKDLEMLAALDVDYHYNTHGEQLLDLNLRARALAAVKKINAGAVPHGETEFLGTTQTMYEVDGLHFLYMPDFLMY